MITSFPWIIIINYSTKKPFTHIPKFFILFWFVGFGEEVTGVVLRVVSSGINLIYFPPPPLYFEIWFSFPVFLDFRRANAQIWGISEACRAKSLAGSSRVVWPLENLLKIVLQWCSFRTIFNILEEILLQMLFVICRVAETDPPGFFQLLDPDPYSGVTNLSEIIHFRAKFWQISFFLLFSPFSSFLIFVSLLYSFDLSSLLLIFLFLPPPWGGGEGNARIYSPGCTQCKILVGCCGTKSCYTDTEEFAALMNPMVLKVSKQLFWIPIES